MKREDKTKQEWLDKATGGIRFRPDRAAVRAELEGHLEDKTADLQRIFPALTQEEAQARALGEMGEAEAIGRELAKVHSPWSGWLYRGSWAVLLVTAAMVLVLLSDPPSYDLRRDQWGTSWLAGQTMEEQLEQWYGAGWEMERQGMLSSRECQAGEYTVGLVQGTLWTLRRTEEERKVLYLVLEAESRRPWEPLDRQVWEGLQARDDRGNTLTYQSTAPGTWGAGLLSGAVLEQRAYKQRVEYILPLPDPGAKEVTLVYTGLGAGLAISVSWEEEQV